MSLTHLESALNVTIGQCSKAGIKPNNEDAIGVRAPSGNTLINKGIVAAIADGVSAAEKGKEASHTAIRSFLNDYYSTHDTWSIQTSGLKVLTSLNQWLFNQGQNFQHAEQGFITTFSAIIFKSASAYLFHVGDCRIQQFRDNNLIQLTKDHDSPAGNGKRYLARALGIDLDLKIDYRQISIEAGDLYLMTCDGIHDFVTPRQLNKLLRQQQDTSSEALDQLCEEIVNLALQQGSNDNVSAQVIYVASAGTQEQTDLLNQLQVLPFPPALEAGLRLDQWKVLKTLRASSRSEVYLVEHTQTQQQAVLKAPSINYEDDAAYIERFILEEWVGQRVISPHVVKVLHPEQKRSFLYYTIAVAGGRTIAEILKERTRISVSDARDIAIQITSGLRAFHRKDCLHQDLKPDNVMFDGSQAVIIDFGSTNIAGLQEIDKLACNNDMLGTRDYSAPEYQLKQQISQRSDQFSLGVLLYEMLTGQRPYGIAYGSAMTAKDFAKLTYRPSYELNPLVPQWMDYAIQRAVSIDANDRYSSLSEFTTDIKTPNSTYQASLNTPYLVKNPIKVWQGLALLSFSLNVYFLYCYFQ